jgi:lysophospholipase L1-like esterase
MSDLPESGVLRILCLGDSITNGGTRVDQGSTYPSLLERRLRDAGLATEVLNASAGGWALENEAGWIRKHGSLNAQLVILQVATHDLFQRMAGGHIVDLNPSFPSRYPPLALVGFWRRVVLPRLGLGADTRDPAYESGVYSLEDVNRGLAAIESIRSVVAERGGRLVVMHVAQADGLEPVDLMTEQAKGMLTDWAKRSGTPFVSTADAMRKAGGTAMFVDVMHPNEAGNAILAREVAVVIQQLLATSAQVVPSTTGWRN